MFYDIINFIRRLLSVSLSKLEQKVFGPVFVKSSTYKRCTLIVIMTWLNCCKLFGGFIVLIQR